MYQIKIKMVSCCLYHSFFLEGGWRKMGTLVLIKQFLFYLFIVF
jgi:hypothetical protein